MKAHFLAASTAILSLAAPSPAAADTICEWWAFATGVIAASQPPATVPRTPDHGQVSVHVALAMFEALNAIDRRYESYLKFPLGEGGASQDAAAISAAHEVLLAHFPARKTMLDENYGLAMAGIADGPAKTAGQRIGKAAGKAAFAAGGIDSTIEQVPYRPRTSPGEWVPTQLPVYDPFSIAFKPWALPNLAAVRPSPPPALDSVVWARDYEEVRRVGGRGSKERSDIETVMARYRITPDLVPALRLAADTPGRSAVRNARLLAILEMAAEDAGHATAAAKLQYNFWRPITAIRNGEADGNPLTRGDPAWVPLINTPNHPEYPCAHCSYAGAVAEVMTADGGRSPAGGVRIASRSLPDAAIQSLPSWDEWVKQVNWSRTLGGVHYRFSNEAGEKLGRETAKLALAKLMRPLPGADQRPAR
jgi:hypothetical protein